jgi:hypothetical protein
VKREAKNESETGGFTPVGKEREKNRTKSEGHKKRWKKKRYHC